MLIFFKELIGTASRVGLYFFRFRAFDSRFCVVIFFQVYPWHRAVLDNPFV